MGVSYLRKTGHYVYNFKSHFVGIPKNVMKTFFKEFPMLKKESGKGYSEMMEYFLRS